MVLPAQVGIEVEENAFMREDEDFILEYVEVSRCFGTSGEESNPAGVEPQRWAGLHWDSLQGILGSTYSWGGQRGRKERGRPQRSVGWETAERVVLEAVEGGVTQTVRCPKKGLESILWV